jgi:CheY-like chemotaxis protein
VAHDGPEALRTLGDYRPDAALLDIGLPVMDGYELARRLREQGAADHLIAVTGYGQDADRARAREVGFEAHVVKPVKLDQLDSLIKRLLGSGPSDDPGSSPACATARES